MCVFFSLHVFSHSLFRVFFHHRLFFLSRIGLVFFSSLIVLYARQLSGARNILFRICCCMYMTAWARLARTRASAFKQALNLSVSVNWDNNISDVDNNDNDDDHNENDNDYDNNTTAKEREIDAAFRLLDDFDFFFSSFTLISQCCVLFCQVKFSVCLVGLHDVRIGNIFFRSLL